MYLFELLACFLFLLFSYKTLLLFSDRGILYYIPILGIIVYSSTSFEYGLTAEEFCLPLMTISLYLCLRDITRKDSSQRPYTFLLIGLLASCVFWIKYTMCGLYIGLFLFYLIVSCKRHEFIGLLKKLSLAFLGFLPLTMAIVVYFIVNNSLSDLWEGYFYNNIFHYGLTNNQPFLIKVLSSEFTGFKTLFHSPLLAIIVLVSLFSLPYKKERSVTCCVIFSFLFTFFFIFVGYSTFYYALSLSVFVPFALLSIRKLCVNISKEEKHSAIFIEVVLFVVSLLFNANINSLVKNKEYPCTKITEYLSQQRHASSKIDILEYGMMDIGVYTLNGIIPQCRNFCHLNLSLKDELSNQQKYINRAHPDYVITPYPKKFEGYRLVYKTMQFVNLQEFPLWQNRILKYLNTPFKDVKEQYYVYERDI